MPYHFLCRLWNSPLLCYCVVFYGIFGRQAIHPIYGIISINERQSI
jgi:hypothetical protein